MRYGWDMAGGYGKGYGKGYGGDMTRDTERIFLASWRKNTWMVGWVLRPKRDRVGYELLREREVITGCFAHGHSILDAHAFYVLRVG
jgi:hypothetical protein